jgi:hypothetical protein
MSLSFGDHPDPGIVLQINAEEQGCRNGSTTIGIIRIFLQDYHSKLISGKGW